MNAIHTLSAVELLSGLEAGEVSSEEIVLALHARADAVEERVKGFALQFRAEALLQAQDADEARARGERCGPLHGLPLTIKESIATQGVPATLGVRSRQGKPEASDAIVVKLLKQAGAIILGKTNISQTLLFHEADNPIWGATSNPWNPARVPGGSSGGEAAVIATGMSPCGIGTDIGGSTRVPAAWCGITAFKPTVDRWSNVGCVSAIPGQEVVRAQCGPMARTVSDLVLLIRAIDSPLHAKLDPAVPPLPTNDPRRVDVRRLRVGYFEDDGFLSSAASVKRAVRQAVAALKISGASVVPFTPPSAADLIYLYLAALSSDGGVTLDRFLDGDEIAPQLRTLRTLVRLPRFIKQIVAGMLEAKGEARVRRLVEVVHEKRIADLYAIAHERTRMRHEEQRAWRELQIDALICPAHATPALRHGQSRDFTLGASCAMRYNFLNFPAGVVPVTRVRPDELIRRNVSDRLDQTAAFAEEGSDGLPLGVQVVAPPYSEDVALALMLAIENVLSPATDYPHTPVDP